MCKIQITKSLFYGYSIHMTRFFCLWQIQLSLKITKPLSLVSIFRFQKKGIKTYTSYLMYKDQILFNTYDPIFCLWQIQLSLKITKPLSLVSIFRFQKKGIKTLLHLFSQKIFILYIYLLFLYS